MWFFRPKPWSFSLWNADIQKVTSEICENFPTTKEKIWSSGEKSLEAKLFVQIAFPAAGLFNDLHGNQISVGDNGDENESRPTQPFEY